MRRNRLVRGGDPMKTRSEKRREKKAKVDKSKRVQRLKKRLGRITAKKFAAQQDTHTTALMESFILRRKAERAAQRMKEQEEEAAAKALAEGDGDDGSSKDGQTNKDLYDMFEEDVFASENPRAVHKRMKDFAKGIRPTQGANGGAQRRRDAVSASTAGKGGSKRSQPPPHKAAKDGGAKPRGRYDRRNTRVEARSLY